MIHSKKFLVLWILLIFVPTLAHSETKPGPEESFVDNGLTNGTRYYYD